MAYTKEQVFAVAADLYNTRYKGAAFVIASGSIMRGKGVVGSDLDIIVFYKEGLTNAYRESFFYNDLPVEAFVHDAHTLQAFFDLDASEGKNTLANMFVQGEVYPVKQNIDNIKTYCKANLTELNTEEISKPALYAISELIVDLRGDRPLEEKLSILFEIYKHMGQKILKSKIGLTPDSKYLARYLSKYAPDFQNTLMSIIKSVCANGATSNEDIEQIEQILKPYGGLFFDGFRQDATSDMRKTPRWLET